MGINLTLDDSGDRIVLTSGQLELGFDKTIGAFDQLTDRSSQITFFCHLPQADHLDVNVDDQWLGPCVHGSYVAHELKENGDSAQLAITTTIRDLLATSTYRLHPGDKLIERTVTIENAGKTEVKLKGVKLVVPGVKITAGKDLLSMASPIKNDDVLTVPCSDIRTRIPLASIRDSVFDFEDPPAEGLGMIVIHNEQAQRSLVCWMHSETEMIFPRVIWSAYGGRPNLKPQAGRSILIPPCATVSHESMIAARLKPGQRVTCGTQLLKIVEGGRRQALRDGRRLIESQSITAPADVPGWITKGAVYEQNIQFLNPLNAVVGMQSARHLEDLKSITDRLAYIRNLGAHIIYLTTFWECETWISYAWKSFDIEQRFGGAEALKTLVDKAHELGLRVVGDLIVHGIVCDAAVVKEHPEWFQRDEHGNMFASRGWGHPTAQDHAGHFSFDWANPGLQDWLVDSAVQAARQFNLDGYRVDAAAFKEPNWDPDIPYIASRSQIAHVQFLKTLRTKLKQINPDAILIAEAPGIVQYRTHDLVYNFWRKALRSRPLGLENALQMRHYLADQQAVLPADSLPLFLITNHDLPSAEHLYGFSRAQAMFAICCFAHGVPLLYSGQETDAQSFFTRLLHARRDVPELTGGQCDYELPRVSDDNVFACARSLGESVAVPLVNLNDRSITLSVELDQLLNDAGQDDDYVLYDLFNDELLATGAGAKIGAAQLGHVTVTMEPYGVRLILLRKDPGRPFLLAALGLDQLPQVKWYHDTDGHQGRLEIRLAGAVDSQSAIKLHSGGQEVSAIFCNGQPFKHYSLGGRARRAQHNLLSIDRLAPDTTGVTVIFEPYPLEQWMHRHGYQTRDEALQHLHHYLWWP